MVMGPTHVENYTFLTAYLHSWAGVTEPIQEAHRASCLGLIHWADQPSKKNIYLVSQNTDGCHLGTDDGYGYPGKLWCIRLIKVVTNSIPASPPPTPPPPNDDQPEDEWRKDKHGDTPGPSDLFRAKGQQSIDLKGSTPQGGTTASTTQSSSTQPQHSLIVFIHPGYILVSLTRLLAWKRLILGKIIHPTITRTIMRDAITMCPHDRLSTHLHHHRPQAHLPTCKPIYRAVTL